MVQRGAETGKYTVVDWLSYGKFSAEPVNILVPTSLYFPPWPTLLFILGILYK
jgi:hypothetical protein